MEELQPIPEDMNRELLQEADTELDEDETPEVNEPFIPTCQNCKTFKNSLLSIQVENQRFVLNLRCDVCGQLFNVAINPQVLNKPIIKSEIQRSYLG